MIIVALSEYGTVDRAGTLWATGLVASLAYNYNRNIPNSAKVFHRRGGPPRQAARGPALLYAPCVGSQARPEGALHIPAQPYHARLL